MYYDGKITTTYAKSPYHVVNKFPNNLIKNYLEILKKIENKRGVFGGPIELKFDGDIPIQKMVEFFKSGKLPFRLWLTPIERKDDFVRMYGVDLHTGDNIGLDIGTNHIWINIPKGTCGNAGLRIPTLLSFAFPYNIKLLLEGSDLVD